MVCDAELARQLHRHGSKPSELNQTHIVLDLIKSSSVVSASSGCDLWLTERHADRLLLSGYTIGSSTEHEMKFMSLAYQLSIYTVSQKRPPFIFPITLSKINRF